MAPKKKRTSTRPRRPAPPTPGRTPTPGRWPALLWTVLALAWLGGSFASLTALFFSGLTLLEAPHPHDHLRRPVATALIWLLVCALAIPLGATAAALVLRRTIAAIGFATALALSALVLFTLMPPTHIWQALRAALA